MLFIAGLWPFNFTEKNEARISPEGGLNIARHGTAYTALPAGKLQGLKQFAIHIDLVTLSDGLDSLEKIFGYLISQEAENFFLAQWKDGLELRVRNERNAAGMIFGADGVFEKDRRTSCLIVYDGQKLSLYKNGTLLRRDTRGPLSFSNWSRDYPLAVGTDAGGRSQWRGTVHEIAVFDRTLTSDEAMRLSGSSSLSGGKRAGTRDEGVGTSAAGRQGKKGIGLPASSFQLQGKNPPPSPLGRSAAVTSDQWPVTSEKKEEKRPLIHYVFKPENTYETEFRGKRALGVRDLGKGEPADLVIPERFAPYKRSYLAWDPDWAKRSGDWVDFIVNIVGFIPFGALLLLALGNGKLGIGRSAAVTSDQWPVTGEEVTKWQERQSGKRGRLQTVMAVGLAVVVGLGVSFAIEYLQAYLPSRDSSLRDLVTNTAGTLIGALAAAWYSRKGFGLPAS